MKRALIALTALTAVGLVLICWFANSGEDVGVAPTLEISAQSSRPSNAMSIDRATIVHDQRDLEALVGRIEIEARHRGELRNDATRTAYAALEQLRPQLGPDITRARAFDLSRRFRRIRRELEVGPIQQHLATLQTNIDGAKDRAAQERMIAEYVATTNTLPEPYRIEAIEKLRR